jgi:hypothetical protein
VAIFVAVLTFYALDSKVEKCACRSWHAFHDDSRGAAGEGLHGLYAECIQVLKKSADPTLPEPRVKF